MDDHRKTALQKLCLGLLTISLEQKCFYLLTYFYLRFMPNNRYVCHIRDVELSLVKVEGNVASAQNVPIYITLHINYTVIVNLHCLK